MWISPSRSFTLPPRTWFIHAFYITIFLAAQVYAALTTAQVSENGGRAIRRGIAQALVTNGREKAFIQTLAIFLKDWVPNGNAFTVAERLEASQTIMREIYTAQTGGNPVDGGAGQHVYKKHWLVDVVGLTMAEANTFEPGL